MRIIGGFSLKPNKLVLVAALASLPFAATATKAMVQPNCSTMDASLPAQVAGWTSKSDLTSAAKANDLSKAALTIGRAAALSLHPTRQVTYLTQPEKPGGSVAFGGMVEINIQVAGTYQVGIASGAWLDVLKDKTPVISTAHGHGPDCTSIRKVVDFPLTPGRYVIQISANADPKIAIMVWRKP